MRRMQSLSDVPNARPSSTVVLVRDADAVPELLMMRRHERSSFGGAFAFPGGVLEPADNQIAEWCDGVTPSEAARLLSDDDGLAYFSAAIRELFEESGVLLATLGAPDVDLDAARACGFKTAFVKRPDEWGAVGPPDPDANPDCDIIVDTFPDLAKAVGAA